MNVTVERVTFLSLSLQSQLQCYKATFCSETETSPGKQSDISGILEQRCSETETSPGKKSDISGILEQT